MVADSSRGDANRVPDEKDSRPLFGKRLGVLISGRGSNLQSIIDAISQGRLDAQIAIVISSRDDAAGLKRAREAGIETMCLRPRDYPGRDAYDRAMAETLDAREVDLVCLAGFMRLVGPPLLAAFPNRMLNIHPSLLPAFPGLDAQRQALDYGVRFSGATVHLVTSELDGGPIVLQSVVPVLEDDTVETLSSRILVEEHRIYPEAIHMLLDGNWSVKGRRVILSATDGRPRA
jgi:phosphoribosylglycinamide formyltransferase-1